MTIDYKLAIITHKRKVIAPVTRIKLIGINTKILYVVLGTPNPNNRRHNTFVHSDIPRLLNTGIAAHRTLVL